MTVLLIMVFLSYTYHNIHGPCVMCGVQVRRIDGVEVGVNERGAAEEAYMEQVMQFNEKIEQVRTIGPLRT